MIPRTDRVIMSGNALFDVRINSFMVLRSALPWFFPFHFTRDLSEDRRQKVDARDIFNMARDSAK